MTYQDKSEVAELEQIMSTMRMYDQEVIIYHDIYQCQKEKCQECSYLLCPMRSPYHLEYSDYCVCKNIFK